MGPTIILDKCSIQSLSSSEIHFVYKYFFVNIPPVLTIEILADLKKDKSKDKSATAYVSVLSKKLLNQDSSINVHYRQLILNELLGSKIEMDRRVLKDGGEIQNENGKVGVVFKQSPEEDAINNWKEEKFEEADKDLAERWRDYTTSLNPEQFKKNNKEITKVISDCKSLEALNELIENLLVNSDVSMNLLMTIIEEFVIDPKLASKIFYRWESSNKHLIKDFAPYSTFCIKVLLLYYLGTLKSFFGRATDKIDLEYIYYLPFTEVFASDDKFLQRIIPFALSDKQTFITGKELKEDLSELVKEWISLSDAEKIDWHKKNKNEPKSITPRIFDLWKKSYPLWSPKKEVVEESTKRSFEDIMKGRGKRVKGDLSPEDLKDLESDDYDFIEVERLASVNDPCPCGSGVAFKDCHLKNIKSN